MGLDTLEGIAADLGIGDAVDLAASLLDKSLVVRVPDPTGATRLSMLETIPSHVLIRSDVDGRLTDARRRQADAVVAIAAEIYRNQGRDSDRALTVFEVEIDNIRAALEWCGEHDPDTAASIFVDSGRLWCRRPQAREGRDWIDRCLSAAHAVDATIRTRLQVQRCVIRARIGDIDPAAHRELRADVDSLRLVEPSIELVTGLLWLAELDYMKRGEATEAHCALALEALAVAERMDLPQLIAEAGQAVGCYLVETGDLGAALPRFARSEQILRAHPDSHGTNQLIANLAWTEIELGLYDSAYDRVTSFLNAARTDHPRENASRATGLTINAAWALIGLRRPLDAIVRLLVAARDSYRSGNPLATGESLVALGCALAQLDEFVLSREALRAADAQLEPAGISLGSTYIGVRRREAEQAIAASERLGSDLGAPEVDVGELLDAIDRRVRERQVQPASS